MKEQRFMWKDSVKKDSKDHNHHTFTLFFHFFQYRILLTHSENNHGMQKKVYGFRAESENFFCKGQDSMLGSVGYRVSITSTQFCHCCESNHRHYVNE